MRKVLILCPLGVIVALFPLVVGPYWLHVAIIALFYAILASSWSLLAGYAGQFSFGHAAFLAIGAYASGLLGIYLNIPPPLGILLGSFVAAAMGLLIGILCLRMSGVYLALFTLAFSEILRVILSTEYRVTRGALGLHVPLLFPGTSKIPYYYTMLGLLIISLFIMLKIVHSRYGLFLRAIREDEVAASSMGVNIVRYRVLAFVLTSFLAGLAGAVYGHYIGVLTPNITHISIMGLIIAMAIIGGVESLLAAALGGILLEFGLEYLRDFGAWRLVLFGGVLMLTLRFARNGLFHPVLRQLLGE